MHVAKAVRSYRDLPLILYHIQVKERDEPRPRAGVLRTREFTMKDSYTFDRDADGLQHGYDLHIQAYDRIFDRCGLEWYRVESDVGMMGGIGAHEYMAPCGAGENDVALSSAGTLDLDEDSLRYTWTISRRGGAVPAPGAADARTNLSNASRALAGTALPASSTFGWIASISACRRTWAAASTWVLASSFSTMAAQSRVKPKARGPPCFGRPAAAASRLAALIRRLIVAGAALAMEAAELGIRLRVGIWGLAGRP